MPLLAALAEVFHALGDAELHAVGCGVVIDATLGQIGLGNEMVVKIVGVFILGIFFGYAAEPGELFAGGGSQVVGHREGAAFLHILPKYSIHITDICRVHPD